jgi:BirA family transcriptional regulator, biotin operon repressor / biotin---[acetyl-CoA-carboxylase] ligase
MKAREPLVQRVCRVLGEGGYHSGEALAARFAVSRSAVWKAVGALAALGVQVAAVRGRGYCLEQPLELLEARAINALLPAALRSRLRYGAVAWSIASTNATLLTATPPAPGQFDYLLAEHQSAGRGRQARRWFAPPAGAICLSLGYSYAALPKDAGALSLAIGVCALRALRELGPLPLALKWPNDLIADGRKLGGILIELRAEAAGPAYVVIGIGINCALGRSTAARVRASGTEACDLAALGVPAVARNALAAALIREIAHGAECFGREGFAPFAAEWRAADALSGRAVAVHGAGGVIVGHARGISADGALCVHTRDGLQQFTSGDVSVRASA